MTYKQEQMINKGYDKESILKLTSYTEEEMEYAVDCAIKYLVSNASMVNNPKCIFIGGQPGAGKSVMSQKLKSVSNAVEISMDACRMYHPRYQELENLVKDFYKDKELTNENNPGNDIASLTQDFSGNMANILIDKISSMNYNILLEWNMRNAQDVLNCMNLLNKKGYTNEAIVVAVNKDISLDACNLRSNVMNSYGHIVRKVSNDFHKLCLDTIPENVDIIYEEGTTKKILDTMQILLRNGDKVWDNRNKECLPSEILNKYYNEKALTQNFTNNKNWAELSYYKESIGLRMREKTIDEDIKMPKIS